MRVIADTSGWYAFFVEKDEFHKSAVKFIKKRPSLITTNLIFEEALALLHHRQGKDVALAASKAIIKTSSVGLRYVTEFEDEEILKIYRKTNKQIDYVDASIIWLAKRMDLPIFSFDAHFKKLNLQLVPQV